MFTKHLDLYGGVSGLGSLPGRLNYAVASSTTSHCFMVGGVQQMVIDSLGLKINTNVGFYNTAPIAKPTLVGAWAGNTAGKALSTLLASLGLLTDSSSA